MVFARVVFRLVVVVVLALPLAVGLFGCGGGTTEDATQVLGRRFPAQATRVLGSAPGFVREASGYVLPSTPSRDGLSVTLPERGGDALRFTTRQGLEIRVREVGKSGGAAEAVSGAAGAAVAYSGPGRTGFWSATLRGAEEWLLLDEDQVHADAPVATWEVDGASARLRRGVVELCDAEGVARVRVKAREAFGAGGRAVGVRLAVVESRIELWVDASAEAVLVDPEWSSTGLMADARSYHTATLLPDGRVLVAGGSNGQALDVAELYDPKVAIWTSTEGSMASSRKSHTATLLPNGKVLVAGGVGGKVSAFLSTAELFDPATQMWTTAGDIALMRQEHTATLLPSGKVLLAGGTDLFRSSLSSAELYDPAVGQWTTAGDMTSARGGHTATLLPSGRVLLAGGRDSARLPLTSAELFDPENGTWSGAGDMASARALHTATLLPNGKVFVACGVDDDKEHPLSGAELYDPTTGTWSTTTYPEAVPRYSHTATLLPNGKVLLSGGKDILENLKTPELFDSAKGTWSRAADMISERIFHTATPLLGGKVLLVGGERSDGIILPTAETYDPAFSIWRAAAPLTVARFGHTATLLNDDRVLVAGGFHHAAAFLASAEIYEPAASAWAAPASDMFTHRGFHTATLLLGGKVLLAGGRTDGGYALTKAELYDPVTGTWEEMGDMILPRYSHTATRLNDGRVLVAGGFNHLDNPTLKLDVSEIFDPATKKWSQAATMPTERGLHTATLLGDGSVLVVGGYAAPIGSEAVYDPSTDNWYAITPMSSRRKDHTATLLPGGKVLVPGGGIGSSYSSTELFDPVTRLWHPSGKMISARGSHAATLFSDDGLGTPRVLVVGGYIVSPLALAEMYVPATETWHQVSPMLEGRRYHTVTMLNDRSALVVGGEDENSVAYASVELYVWSSNGTLCLYDHDCMSEHCIDGVCCATDCPRDGCHACAFAAGAHEDGKCHAFADGFLCDDDDVCSAVDVCQGAKCVGTSRKSCNGPADECHTLEECNRITGQCEAAVEPDGKACTGNKCASEAECMSGVCTTTTALACPCFEPGTCDPAIGCEGGVAILCADNLRCNPELGCPAQCEFVTDCVDGFVCDPSHQCVPPPDRHARDDAGCSVKQRSAKGDAQAAFSAVSLVLVAALAPLRRRRRSAIKSRTERRPSGPA